MIYYSYINYNIIINDVLVQKGSGEAMLVKFLNPFEDEQKLFMGAFKQVQCKNVQCNKFNSLQYSIIIPYTCNNIHTQIYIQ